LLPNIPLTVIKQVIFYWILIMRHMIRLFELRPYLQPSLPSSVAGGGHKIALSDAQTAQIREVFELFDIDGGGSIDRRELDFAMVSLGFQKKKRIKPAGAGNPSRMMGSGMIDTIIEDGAVTLDEFTALMTGELSGRDPVDTVRAVFAVLSGGDAGKRQRVEESIITLESLVEASKKYEVMSLYLSMRSYS
jgi:Ca2+-binding EF-hand superfamily protein